MSYITSATEDLQGAADSFSGTVQQGRDVASPTFIDLFSGCGGLSLGLCQAGWRGRFAIERAEDAFETFRANFLVDGGRHKFDWPEWLEQRAYPIEEVLQEHKDDIARLRGKVDLIAGGPPCQGFSFAGKRSASDPRNMMFRKYVQFVELVRPKFLVLENVPGMDIAHKDGRGTRRKTHLQKLVEELDSLGYDASGCLFDAAGFGVPQRRTRLVVLGIYRGDKGGAVGMGGAIATQQDLIDEIFRNARREGGRQLEQFGVERVTAELAISDLEGGDRRLTTSDYAGSQSRAGYRQVRYQGPKTKYQEWMHQGASAMDSMRLAKHTDEVRVRFQKILKLTSGRRGVNLSAGLRDELRMLKHRTVPMDSAKPAPTLTTLPDDILHYSEPRILTVREYARLQSFPDWFVFMGKYTTGGARRRVESPRYTQVGNAVPPLLGRAIGVSLIEQIHGRRLVHAAPAGMRVLLSNHARSLALQEA